MKNATNIFLIGPMGAGKTSVGKALARKLNLEFYDSDQEIEQYTGANIPWIFDIEGEEGFRRRETKVLDILTQKQGIVLATGGGAILNPINRGYLSQRGIVVYLKVNINDQLQRTSRSRNRPLLLNENPREILERLKNERDPLYLAVADCVIETDVGSVSLLVDKIIQEIKKYSKTIGKINHD